MAGKVKSSERATEAQVAKIHADCCSADLPLGQQGRGRRTLTGHRHAQA